MLDLSPSSDAKRHTGQCACGDVRIAADVTKTYGVCHCQMCRRWAGGVWMGVLAGRTMVCEIFYDEKPDHYAFGAVAVAYTGWGFWWALLTGRLAK